jgi:hypothetical protein
MLFLGVVEMAICENGRKPIDQWCCQALRVIVAGYRPKRMSHADIRPLAWVQERDNPAGL